MQIFPLNFRLLSTLLSTSILLAIPSHALADRQFSVDASALPQNHNQHPRKSRPQASRSYKNRHGNVRQPVKGFGLPSNRYTNKRRPQVVGHGPVVPPFSRSGFSYRNHPDYWRNKEPRHRYYYQPRYRYPQRPYYPRHSYHYRGNDFFGWLAFTAVTLAIIDNLNDQQQHEHERTLRKSLRSPVGETVRWYDNDASGSVTTTREGRSSEGRYCREYTQKVEVNGKSQQVYGMACRNSDGSWEIKN